MILNYYFYTDCFGQNWLHPKFGETFRRIVIKKDNCAVNIKFDDKLYLEDEDFSSSKFYNDLLNQIYPNKDLLEWQE